LDKKGPVLSGKTFNVAGCICSRGRIRLYMRSNFVKRAVKISIIVAMLVIGAMIGLWNNAESASAAENKQYGTINTVNNLWVVIPMLLVNLAFIPAGWLIGRKLDKDN